MEQINKLFVEFLKDNNVLKQYVKNVKRLKKDYFQTWENYANPFTIQPLEQCLNGVGEIEDLIDRAFFWADTQEGRCFWSNLDMEWRVICRSHKKQLK